MWFHTHHGHNHLLVGGVHSKCELPPARHPAAPNFSRVPRSPTPRQRRDLVPHHALHHHGCHKYHVSFWHWKATGDLPSSVLESNSWPAKSISTTDTPTRGQGWGNGGCREGPPSSRPSLANRGPQVGNCNPPARRRHLTVIATAGSAR